MKGLQRLRHLLWRSFPAWVVCLVIGCVALAFNLYRLGAPSIWFDEVLSVERARQTLPVLWQIIFSTQPNMAFYYILLHFWLGLTNLFGMLPTEFVVRLPSAIFAALGTMMLFLLGRRFLGTIAGLTGAVLYLLNTQQLTYAQDTRSYSMQLFLLSLAWYAFFSALTVEKRHARWWICFTLASTLAVYTHVFSLLVLFTQALVFGCLLILPTAWRAQVRRQFFAGVASAISAIILLIPILFVSLHGGRTEWLPTPRLTDAVHVLLTIAGDSKLYLLLLVLFCALGVVGVALAWLPEVARRFPLLFDERKVKRLRPLFPVIFALVCWCAVPFVLSFIISQGQTHLFSSRYLVVLVPPLTLLAGMGVEIVGNIGWPRIQAGLAILAIVATSLSVPIYYQSAEVENWRDGALWIEQQYQPGDGMVCYDNAQGCQVSIEYYFRAYPQNGATFPSDSPGSFPWVRYDLTNAPGGDPGAAVDTAMLADYGAKHGRIFFIVGRLDSDDKVAKAQQAQQWLDTHYHYVTQVVTPTVSVRLYDTKPV